MAKFPAAALAAQQFPEFIEELRTFFGAHGIATGSAGAIAELTARLGERGEFREDAVSMLRVMRFGDPEIGPPELVGVLLVAATGLQDERALEEAMPGGVPEALFQLARQAARFETGEDLGREAELTPVAAAKEQIVPELRGEERVVFAADGAIPSSSRSDKEVGLRTVPVAEATTAAAMAEAVAVKAAAVAQAKATEVAAVRVADSAAANEEEEASPVIVVSPQAPGVEAPVVETVPRSARFAPRREPLPLAAAPVRRERPASARRSPYRWLYAAGGVLLGLLLGFFLEREHPLLEPTHPAAENRAVAGPSVPEVALPRETEGRSRVRSKASRRGEASRVGAGERGVAVPRSLGADASGTVATAREDALRTGSLSSAASARAAGASGRAGLVKGLPLGPASDLDPEVPRNPSAHPGQVRVGTAGIMAANVLSSPTPAYPAQASAAAVQGEVVVEAIVGRSGDVIDTRVVSGPLLLREAALGAVQRWRYRPYEVDGKPEEIATTARVEFRLDGR